MMSNKKEGIFLSILRALPAHRSPSLLMERKLGLLRKETSALSEI